MLKKFVSQITDNYAISYLFCLYLMLHAYTIRFKVMGNVKIFCKNSLGTKQGLQLAEFFGFRYYNTFFCIR